MPGYDGREAITREARPGEADQVRLVRGPHFQHDPEERRPDLNGIAGSVGSLDVSTMVREIASVNETSVSVSVAALTAEIVTAYVSNNQIAMADLAGLITTVAGQLRRVGAEPEQPSEEKPEPAVSVRRSVRPDHLLCLVCGKPQKMLKRHLAARHELTPAQYRERFGLKPDYPMTAPNYAQQRREVALAAGLGRPQTPARRGRQASVRSPAKELSRPEASEAGG
jgi:predicted transcriptional regulator